MSGVPCTVTRTKQGLPGVAVSIENSQDIRTIRDLGAAAHMAGILPSELIARVWPQHAASASAG